MRLHIMIGLFLGVAVLAACAPAATPPSTPTPNPLAGGVLVTFDVDGEVFRVWVTNPATIEQIIALRDGKSQANIPNGAIREGPGQGNHNAPWSWHLDPEEIEMAEMTIELCDGRPTYVEENLAEFVNTVGRYCPWSARLVEVQDYR